MKIHLSKGRVLDAPAFTVSFSRSSGPGGQHVNKVATKVRLQVDLKAIEALLTEAEYRRLRRSLKNRISQNQYIAIDCDETRHQKRNLKIALSRMEKLLRSAMVLPKRRKATKPSRASIERRLTSKKQQSEKKKNRGKVTPDTA